MAQRIEELIKSGQVPPRFRLENEIALADQLGLSRPTMRQAMEHLVDKGLVARCRGVGTEVAADRRPRTDALSFSVMATPEEAIQALSLNPGAQVVAIERLRYADEEPLALMHNYLPAGVADVTAEVLWEPRGAPLLTMARTAPGSRWRKSSVSVVEIRTPEV